MSMGPSSALSSTTVLQVVPPLGSRLAPTLIQMSKLDVDREKIFAVGLGEENPRTWPMAWRSRPADSPARRRLLEGLAGKGFRCARPSMRRGRRADRWPPRQPRAAAKHLTSRLACAPCDLRPATCTLHTAPCRHAGDRAGAATL